MAIAHLLLPLPHAPCRLYGALLAIISYFGIFQLFRTESLFETSGVVIIEVLVSHFYNLQQLIIFFDVSQSINQIANFLHISKQVREIGWVEALFTFDMP